MATGIHSSSPRRVPTVTDPFEGAQLLIIETSDFTSTSTNFGTAKRFASDHGRLENPEVIIETHADPGVIGLIENADREVFEQVPTDPEFGTYRRYMVTRLVQ